MLSLTAILRAESFCLSRASCCLRKRFCSLRSQIFFTVKMANRQEKQNQDHATLASCLLPLPLVDALVNSCGKQGILSNFN